MESLILFSKLQTEGCAEALRVLYDKHRKHYIENDTKIRVDGLGGVRSIIANGYISMVIQQRVKALLFHQEQPDVLRRDINSFMINNLNHIDATVGGSKTSRYFDELKRRAMQEIVACIAPFYNSTKSL